MKALTLKTQAPAKKNPAAVYLASLAPSGRRALQGRLKVVADMFGQSVESLPWHEIRYEHVQAIRSKLQETDQAPSTINAAIYAIRGTVKAAFNLGLMSADNYERIRNVKPVKGERLPPGRALSVKEIRDMLDTCTGVIGARDSALIAIMYAAGLRRAELVNLDVEHYNQDTGELKVLGKGNKERLLYINNGAEDALNDWLSIRGDSPGPLFNPVNKSGIIQYRRLTEDAIYGLLKRRAEKAKINRFSPHDLRRSFVSELLDRGADIAIVQQLAGHANIQTTAKYDRRGEEAKKKAIRLLNVPYTRMKQN